MIGVIFDLDGTLVDSASAIAAIGDQLMRERGLAPLSTDEGRGYVGRGAAHFLEQALGARDALDPTRFDADLARFREIYAAAPGADNPPFAGVEDALGRLQEAGHPLAICTNKPMTPTMNVLRALKWERFFGAVVAGDTLPVRKPDPAPLREAAQRIETPRYIFVGDSEVDAETAEAADAPFLLHARGYRKGPAETIRADERFEDFAVLPALVAERALASRS